MDRAEAEALAAKREAHKSKHMRLKCWRAVEQPDGSWKASLEDTAQVIAQKARATAPPIAPMDPLMTRMLVGQMIMESLPPATQAAIKAIASERLMERVKAALGEDDPA